MYVSVMIGSKEIESPAFGEIEAEIEVLRRLNQKSPLVLVGQNDTEMLIYYIDSYGFFVHSSFKDDLNFYILVDPSKGKDMVNFWAEDNNWDYPKDVLVDIDFVKIAARSFWESGSKSCKVNWVNEDELQK